MAGVTAGSEGASLNASALSRQQFRTIAWLRWRIFVNSLRGKGAAGELVIKIISYPILAALIFGPAVGSGAASYYLIESNQARLLAIPLWIIFGLWQFIGVSTSTTAPSFDLATLIRFPIRYRDYLLMRLSFGLMDAPTLAGIGCLLGSAIGISVAAPALLPWAALNLLVYAACNVLFSRMIYSWLERWLAQRRTRELFTVLILVVSLGFQFVSQYLQRLGNNHHGPMSPWTLKTAHILVAANWLLPPGLTASSIAHMHDGFLGMAAAALGGLVLYTAAFLSILHVRLHAQYVGENLSEAPSQAKARAVPRKQRVGTVGTLSTSHSSSLLPATVMACLIKEIRYLARSGPKLYALIMPVFMVFLLSARNTGTSFLVQGKFSSYLFSYGCAYTQLILVALLYNSLGSDGAGVQFYLIAPLRMRDVILAKNLMAGGILAIEIVLVYIASSALSPHSSASVVAATLAWSAFAFLLNMSIGNVRSLISPKAIDPGKVRRQNVSGLSSFISLGVVLGAMGLGVAILFLCRVMGLGYWAATAVFAIFAAISFVVYLVVLRNVDRIALEHVEDLTRELSKAG